MKITFLALAATLCASSFAFAQESLLSNGDFSQDGKGWTYRFLGQQAKAPKFVEAAPVEGVSRAFRAEVVAEENLKAFSMTMGQPFGRAIATGEKIKWKFWARSDSKSALALVLGTTLPPHRTYSYKRIPLSSEWKEYAGEGVAKENLAAGEADITFHFALAPGDIELTGVQIWSETP